MINKILIIHNLVHQILANKHNPSEMNHQIWNMETPPNQTLQNKTKNRTSTNTRTKVQSRKFKENL